MSINRTLKRSLQGKLLERYQEAISQKNFDELQNIEPMLNKALKHPANLILLSDAYKFSHHKFYPNNTTKVYSYLESRGGKFSETVFFGLQIFIKEYLEGVAILAEEVDEAYEYLGTKLGVFGRDDVFDRSKFDYIVEKHGGKLPIIIKAVPEGTVVGTKNVLLTIENTDPNCAWLTNFLETLLLQLWYPVTVASLSREVKKIALKYWRKTSSLPIEVQDFCLQFVLNDFGARGVSSMQSALVGGSAHLLNFLGSDTTIASTGIFKYYNSDLVGASVPATEHSIMTIKGEAGEIDMMRRTLELYPTGIVACVSDSFNIFKACAEKWGTELRDLILSRPAEPGNQLVIRPDSGDPKRTLEEIFKILFEKFGYTVNDKGYKVLPPQVRVIQGDGVNINSIGEIYEMMDIFKISAENIVFGMGGKLLQAGIDRDTQNFATKAAFAVVDGVEVDVIKSPTEMDSEGNITPSFKKSKSGRLKLVKAYKPNGFIPVYQTITSKEEFFETSTDELVEVFNNGELLVDWTFEEVRKRAAVVEPELV